MNKLETVFVVLASPLGLVVVESSRTTFRLVHRTGEYASSAEFLTGATGEKLQAQWACLSFR